MKTAFIRMSGESVTMPLFLARAVIVAAVIIFIPMVFVSNLLRGLKDGFREGCNDARVAIWVLPRYWKQAGTGRVVLEERHCLGEQTQSESDNP